MHLNTEQHSPPTLYKPSTPILLFRPLTVYLIKTKKMQTPSSLDFWTGTMIRPTNFRVFIKVLIINNSAIIWICSETLQTSSELIWTRSELISTRSELIFRIAEQIAFAPHSTLRWTAESGDLRGVLVSYPRLKAWASETDVSSLFLLLPATVF